MEARVSMDDLRQVMKELAEQSRETDRKLAEQAAASRAEAERRAADFERRVAEADRQTAELKRQMRETDRKIAAVGKQIGDLGNRLGEFVEGVVRPGLVRLFRERGLDVRETHQEVVSERHGRKAEIDLLAIDDRVAVAVEVKSKLAHRDVEDHLARLAAFKEMFPRYADMDVYGAMAAMVLPDKQVQYAERCGLFVIGQAGDDAVLVNSPGFEPRAW